MILCMANTSSCDYLSKNSSLLKKFSFFGTARLDEFLSSRLGTPDAAGRCLFSRLPPGFPVVPQYLGHTSVVPQPLTEPDKRLSRIRLFTQTFSFRLNGFMSALSPIRVRFVLTVFSRLESCLCFFLHGRSSAGTFTPRGLAVSSLHRFPSRYKDPI